MKQFQKYGVAAAVATLATGTYAVDPLVSELNAGDLAIVPYYTVLDGKNTGIHVINTTDSTQVVKVRLRRGADSADALDFNLIMSPRDEWTANIGAGGTTGVRLTTNDTTCTVPVFPNGIAQMPPTYSAGATEGYVEIIGMAQTTDEKQPIAVAAKHAIKGATEGVPADCAAVRQNFFRVTATAAEAADASEKGVHTSKLTSNGACSDAAAAAASAAGSGACFSGVGINLSNFTDTADQALKVSYMITDSTEGLEVGGNAVHVEGFSESPMMTNQQPLEFGSAGIMQYDPLNFELPNLAYGAYPSSVQDRKDAGADGTDELSSGAMFTDLRIAMDTQAVINDWASFENSAATVATDWVVTLPGQYAMNNNLCSGLDALFESDGGPKAAGLCNISSTAGTTGKSIGSAAAAGWDQDELPLILASNTKNPTTEQKARLLIWDREEKPLNSVVTAPDGDLGFSPGGVNGEKTDTVTLNREVNVIVFDESATSTGVLGSAEEQDETLGLRVYAEYSGKGWGELQIEPKNASPKLWKPATSVDDDADIKPNSYADGFGSFDAIYPNTPAIGFAVWERNFAEQAGNYGRLVEHSTVISSGGRVFASN